MARDASQLQFSPLQLMSETASCLADYERVPIAFEVSERLDVEPVERGLGGLRLCPRPVESPYVKDYDRLAGQRPTEWAGRWDVARWWFAAAFLDGRRVGGAAVVTDAAEFQGVARPGAAVLWDIRVCPHVRHRGVGRRLIAFAEDHARTQGRRYVDAETQNTNVAACRFYASAGYVLVGIDRHAYPDLPDEARLLWRKVLA